MPFEIGTFSVTLFALPQDLLGIGTLSAGFPNRTEHRALEQSDLHQSAQSGAQDSVFHAQGMVPAGGTGLDACQWTNQRTV